MEKQITIKKIIIKLIVFILALASVFAINSLTYAVTYDEKIQTLMYKRDNNNSNNDYYGDPYAIYWNSSRMLPGLDFGRTGLLPQYYTKNAERSVQLQSNRAELSTQEWNGLITGESVFCSKFGGCVKYGSIDKNRYFLYPHQVKIAGYNLTSIVTERETVKYITENTCLNEAEEWFDSAMDDTKKHKSGFQGFINSSYDYSISYGSELNKDALGFYYRNSQGTSSSDYLSTQDRLARAHNRAGAITKAIFKSFPSKMLAREIQDDSTDGKESDLQSESEAEILGVNILVTETETGNNNGYGIKQESTFKSDNTNLNQKAKELEIEKAFVLTTLENAYKYNQSTGKYEQKDGIACEYSLNDIQVAYWLILDDEGTKVGNVKGSYKLTEKGKKLYEKCTEYKNFVINELSNYDNNVQIDNSKTKIIPNLKDGTYTVGPIKITYPEHESISYIKALTIKAINKETGEEKELILSEDRKDFQLILDPETGIQSGNGITREFPKSDQEFSIVFNAKDAGYPTNVDISVKTEYIDNSKIDYSVLDALCDVYRYEGYTAENRNSVDDYVTIEFSIDYEYTDTRKVYDYTETIPHYKNGEYWYTEYKTHYKDEEYTARSTLEREYTFNFWQPYIKMTDEPVDKVTAQSFTRTEEGQRVYKTVDKSISATIPSTPTPTPTPTPHDNDYPLDLTTELGGKIWVDENGGKEDIANGIYDSASETLVSGVTVKLYQVDTNGTVTYKKETKTDANGEYRFTELNAMYKYYVEFIYNGQYYEPTEYTSPNDSTNGWGKGTWPNNSNATDLNREEYNNRFSVINSASDNYKGTDGKWHQTYTKMELLGYTLQDDGTYSPELTYDAKGNVMPADNGKAVIDQFGNVTGTDDNPMTQYARDCAISAFTKAGSVTEISGYDKYPTPDIFMISNMDEYNKLKNSSYNMKAVLSLIASKNGETVKWLYDDALYINLGLHPRQEVDIAVKKDVEKVTLEINNKVHEYTYDTLDTFKCDKCGHVGKFTEAKYKMNLETYRWKYECPECGGDIEANWDISVRLSDTYHNEDGYYDTSYDRGIYKSDYIYKVSAYGYGNGVTTPEQARSIAETMYGKSQADELEIYVTYKIMVSNQSLSIRTRIDELVDYYDSTYTLVPERSYIEINRNGEGEKHSIVLSEDSKCGPTNNIGDYSRIFIRGIGKSDSDDYYLKGGESAYFYVTFKVNKSDLAGEKWLQLGEKENLAELNGYSTKYADGTKVPNRGDVGGKPAGIVDMNSTPGNQRNTDIRENDTDKAPSINIHLYEDDSENRVIEGSIWEDERTKELKTTTIGNGTLDNGETLINGVTVQLVELMENGSEFIWREFGSNITGNNGVGIAAKGTEGDGTGSGMKETEAPIINAIGTDGNALVQDYVFNADNHNGQYAFKSFMPGNYVVRFKYGDTVRTALPQDLTVNGLTTNTLKGLNAKSYNGQDYKSTTYQAGVEQNKTYTWNQTPVKIVQEGNGMYRLWQGDADSIQNWQYGYVTYNGTNLVFTPTWDNVGQRQVAPKLTEVSTFKADGSNNETVVLPTIDMVTAESLNTPVIDVNKQNGYLYDITASDSTAVVSDAKDIESRRNVVNDYSDNDVVNHEAEVLASHKSDYTITAGEETRKDLVKELIDNTQMTAETGLMVIEFEYDDKDTDIKVDPEYTRQGKYTIQNVNLGLEERPKAQLELEKEITNVKLTLADSSVLFDAKQSTSNVLWNDHKDYKTGYKGNFMDPSKFGNIENIRKNNITKFGLVQLTMDEELMHGATIKIDYKVTVKNVGEVDYYEIYKLDGKEYNIQNRLFYYKGEVTDKAQVVTTRADEVMDYVANNLQFNVADNNVENSNKWQVKSNDQIANEKLVNTKLIEDKTIDKYNTKIFTESLNAELVPRIYKDKVDNNRQDSTDVPLVLTQLVTSENSTDDLTYRNIVELVRTSNKVGRRMEYSVVGNQNPTRSPAEIDTDLSEQVKILPPFGTDMTIYMIISIIVIAGAGMLVPSIIFIKQKVLKK